MKPEVRPGNVCLDYCINCSPNCKIVWLTPLFSIYVSFVQISFWLTFMFCSPFPVLNSIMCLCLFIWVPFIVWHHVFWVTASERTTRPSRQNNRIIEHLFHADVYRRHNKSGDNSNKSDRRRQACVNWGKQWALRFTYLSTSMWSDSHAESVYFPVNLAATRTRKGQRGLTHSFPCSKRYGEDEGQVRDDETEGKRRRWWEKYSGDRVIPFGLWPK